LHRFEEVIRVPFILLLENLVFKRVRRRAERMLRSSLDFLRFVEGSQGQQESETGLRVPQAGRRIV
jgi:hypothetical protein